jgi:hypothetical protein
MEPSSVIVVASPQWAENQLRSGALSCPHCTGPLRPYGHARLRTVRGLGTATLTAKPRRARCTDCRATQVLLPATMTYRRADSTEVIGHAQLLVRPAPQPTLLGRALNLLAGAALRHRERFAHNDPPWALISCMSNGHLLAPPLKT